MANRSHQNNNTNAATLLAAFLAFTVVAEPDCSKPPHFRPHKIQDCCTIPDIRASLTEAFQEKCPLEIGEVEIESSTGQTEDTEGRSSMKRRKGPPPNHMCIFECIFNETQILEDGELNEEKIEIVLNQIFEDREVVEVYKEAFKTSATKIKEKNSKFQERRQNHRKDGPDGRHKPFPFCSPLSGILVSYTRHESLVNCPDSKWSDAEECNEAREYLKTCGFPKRRGGQERHHHGRPHNHQQPEEL